MKLVARRHDLDLSLAGKFGYGLSGVLGWNVELPNLGESRCDVKQRDNHNCCEHPLHIYVRSPRPLLLLSILAGTARPLLILAQMTDDGIVSLRQLNFILQIF